MIITDEIFQAHLRCQTKCHLKFTGVVGAQNEINDWQQRIYEEYKKRCWALLRSTCHEDEYFLGTLSPQQLALKKYQYVIGCIIRTDEIQSHIHVLELLPQHANRKFNPYVPTRFIASEKITGFDKLLLAFDALALFIASGKIPLVGKLIYGEKHKTVKVRLPELIKNAKKIIDKITAQQLPITPPPLILNKHCPECEYKERCRQLALEKDELTLLSSMTEKERSKLNSKGIFSITQLSYTYRPRRRPKRFISKPDKYSHALKALSIRERKIHIAGKPELNTGPNPVYIDVEGSSDRGFYYLIGLRFKNGDSYIQHSFWANDQSEEREIWISCLGVLQNLESPLLIHYGSYESVFLKQMKERYGMVGEEPASLERLIKESVNILSVIYAQIYFPTYSNGLKEVAQYLGFQWSDKAGSGLKALASRSMWEISRDSTLKEKLITYNAEDCEALEIVTHTVIQLCQQAQTAISKGDDVVYTDSLKRRYPQRFGSNDFKMPELEYINQCAYWNYQRDKIYVRSSPQIKYISKKRKPARHKPFPVNTTIGCPPDTYCPHCKSDRIRKYGRMKKVVHDLKFSRTGIKRWIIKYSYGRYFCVECNVTFVSQHRPLPGRFGWQLLSYAIYQIIELHISQRTVASSLNQLFGFHMNRSEIYRQKARAAEFYERTCRGIIRSIVHGKLIQVDETRVVIEGKIAYVWVLTNLEEVAYFYTQTREADFIKELLANFKGILVSDFYTAYDAINCPQQKCLIHLIRDLNDDLLKHPFNEELKELVKAFAALMKPIIETVDRFGLKAHYLRKHKVYVERFYKMLSRLDIKSAPVTGWKKRFDKNRDKLFTFLDYDGIPWNNNNAEHAVKAFARLRRVIAGTSSDNGINEYLILLSICETCKYKGVRFLDFLRSGETDIYKFIKKNRRKLGK